MVDKISGPMGGGILYTTGAEAENSAVNFSKNSVPPLYKNQSPKNSNIRDFQKALETTTATKRRKIGRKICSKCAVSNLSFHGRCISRSLHDSAKVVISRLLTRNCCSLAVVVSANICLSIPLNDGKVEKSSFHSRCCFGTSVGRTGTLESRSFVAVVVSCAV